MNLKQLFLTKNNCYLANRTITPKGIMVHSTGANNPNLSRYVGPDDGLLGENRYGNHWNTPKPSGISVCVHAFIGRLKDGSIATYQTLPWNRRGWHGGGTSNDTHIGFEICEGDLDDAEYFQSVYQEAVELCGYLCREFGFDPMRDIICHSEGHTMGIASNHGDVMHWFPRHGKSMDTFRMDVQRLLQGEEKSTTTLKEITSLFGTGDNPSPSHMKATRFCIEQGIFQGDGNGNFGWQQCVTREQIAQLFYNLFLEDNPQEE